LVNRTAVSLGTYRHISVMMRHMRDQARERWWRV
jgi:hypothetical protein